MQWSVSAGSNPAVFEIERSRDAAQFASIGTLPGRTSGATLVQYSFTDHEPAAGVNYYRLKMTDTDGNQLYSGIRSLDFGGGAGTSLLVYPNPATDQLTISTPGITGTAELLIINTAGSVVRRSQFSSTGMLRVSIRAFPTGLYFVEVRQGSERSVKSFFKN